MEKCIIFGAGSKTRISIEEIKRKYEVMFIVDNDKSTWGGYIDEIVIDAPERLKEHVFDKVILCNMIASVTIDWLYQLEQMGIPRNKICLDYCVYITDAREIFVRNYARLVYERGICGNVAEAGVYKGEFAKIMNEVFPDRKCYLFDTFEGFSEENLNMEKSDMHSMIGRFGDTTEEIVLEKMKYPEQILIKKGLFPESAQDVFDTFVFVNLDMDLKYPTVDGLNFFCDKMTKRGIILIHDYFSKYFSSVKEGVDEWLHEHQEYLSIPIGDNMSVAILKG